MEQLDVRDMYPPTMLYYDTDSVKSKRDRMYHIIAQERRNYEKSKGKKKEASKDKN